MDAVAERATGTDAAGGGMTLSPADVATFPEHPSLAARVAWIALLMGVALVPLICGEVTRLGNVKVAPLTYDQYDILKTATLWVLLAVATGAWLWSVLVDGRPLRLSRVNLLLILLLGWVAVATVFSIHLPTAIFGKYRRFEGLVAFVGYGLLFFLTVQFGGAEGRARRLAQIVALSGALVAFYGVLQYLGLDPIPRTDVLPFEANRAYSTMGNPDLLAGYLIFPLTLSLCLALAEQAGWWRLTYWIAFLLSAGAWLTTFTRGAWIGGMVAVALVLFGAIRARFRPRAVDVAMGGVAVATGVGVVVHSLGSSSSVTNVVFRLRSLLEFGQGSGRTRTEIWASALQAIKSRPLVGHGPDTFRLVFPRYKVPEYARDAGYASVADNAHNYPLQLASGIGVPGLMLVYGLFGWVLVGSAREAYSGRRGSGLSPLLGFWAAVVGYLVYLMTGLSVVGSSLLLWIALGLLVAPAARSVSFSLRPLWRSLALTGAGLMIALVLLADASFVVADHYYLMSKVAADPMVAISNAKRAVRFNPFVPDYRFRIMTAYGDMASRWFHEADRLQSSGQDPTSALAVGQPFFDQATRAGLAVQRFIPPEFDTYPAVADLYNLGGTYLDQRYYEEAARWAERGLEVEPYGLPAMFAAGFAYVNLGRADKAIPLLKQAAALDPAYGPPRQLLGDIYRNKGDRPQAEAWYREALGVDPNDGTTKAKLDDLLNTPAKG